MNLRTISFALGLALVHVVSAQNEEGRVFCQTYWGPWTRCVGGTRRRIANCKLIPRNCVCNPAKEFATCQLVLLHIWYVYDHVWLYVCQLVCLLFEFSDNIEEIIVNKFDAPYIFLVILLFVYMKIHSSSVIMTVVQYRRLH